MNCGRFRQAVCEDPTSSNAELECHERECESCAAYAARARLAEHRIRRALRFDIEAVEQALGDAIAISARPDLSATWAAFVAAVVVAIAVWFGATAARPASDDELIAAVLAHWDHEPDSWSFSDARVSRALLDDVLSGTASIDTATIGTISFARSCWVAGEWLPHLVVQSERGPVMVLLLREYQIERAMRLELPEQGLAGTLQPVEGGSIAVLGDGAEPLESIERRIASAVNLGI